MVHSCWRVKRTVQKRRVRNLRVRAALASRDDDAVISGDGGFRVWVRAANAPGALAASSLARQVGSVLSTGALVHVAQRNLAKKEHADRVVMVREAWCSHSHTAAPYVTLCNLRTTHAVAHNSWQTWTTYQRSIRPCQTCTR